MATLSTWLQFDLDSLAEDIAWSDAGNEEKIDFILTIDAAVADVDFTTELIKRLQETLDGN